ncbi:type II toxin-antitoxin system RelE/ParE family toxin [Roseovarius spongiae]|uniref:Type II toxin-antitoxin system RelE/ParE family toxin n=1 Tax=Roseovarius spongiae TaxID=2320272 RepID=A0A3A8AXZ5_9RHOB|nr:type II toxin-antitoxin system RelE/ParE family toxin [Roseovarius spongiae]RKF16777.1 type II toxin-antitoxin system RelE/ParE family toxin [Roseovarius spongiae]
MRIVFLPTTAADLSWFRTYYARVFPEGAARAKHQLRNLCHLLEANPYAGHPGQLDGIRELHIPRTPFTLIYRVTARHIEVLRLWDERQGKFD